jgi:hypothetical protein
MKNIEVFQEESYKVTIELVTNQGKVKQTVQETIEKLKTHLNAKMVEEIVHQVNKVQGKCCSG